jgi:hypothetical protein
VSKMSTAPSGTVKGTIDFIDMADNSRKETPGPMMLQYRERGVFSTDRGAFEVAGTGYVFEFDPTATVMSANTMNIYFLPEPISVPPSEPSDISGEGEASPSIGKGRPFVSLAFEATDTGSESSGSRCYRAEATHPCGPVSSAVRVADF